MLAMCGQSCGDVSVTMPPNHWCGGRVGCQNVSNQAQKQKRWDHREEIRLMCGGNQYRIIYVTLLHHDSPTCAKWCTPLWQMRIAWTSMPVSKMVNVFKTLWTEITFRKGKNSSLMQARPLVYRPFRGGCCKKQYLGFCSKSIIDHMHAHRFLKAIATARLASACPTMKRSRRSTMAAGVNTWAAEVHNTHRRLRCAACNHLFSYNKHARQYMYRAAGGSFFNSDCKDVWYDLKDNLVWIQNVARVQESATIAISNYVMTEYR